MLPDHVLSSEVIATQFQFPRNIPRRPLIDYEYGGAALQDPSDGLRFMVWKAEYIDGHIYVSADGVPLTSILTVANLRDFSFTFDQNMNPFVAYETDTGSASYYWYDSTIPGFTTTALPGGSTTPRAAIDDNRATQTGSSDIILAYCRAGSLYFREQRDRFLIERLLDNTVGARGLIQVGMNRALRFQFMLSTA